MVSRLTIFFQWMAVLAGKKLPALVFSKQNRLGRMLVDICIYLKYYTCFNFWEV